MLQLLLQSPVSVIAAAFVTSISSISDCCFNCYFKCYFNQQCQWLLLQSLLQSPVSVIATSIISVSDCCCNRYFNHQCQWWGWRAERAWRSRSGRRPGGWVSCKWRQLRTLFVQPRAPGDGMGEPFDPGRAKNKWAVI